MLRNRFKRIIGVLLLASAVISSLSLASCNMEPAEEEDKAPTEYIVAVMTEGKMAFSEVTVQVYKDEAATEFAWGGRTDKNGEVSFTVPAADTYYAVLSEVAAGYDSDKVFEIRQGRTEIFLRAVIADGGDSADMKYERGSVIGDFTFMGSDGTEYRLSEVLKEKKVVVLNFWFENCGPCKSEFPHMQEAYEKYSDKIEIFAMNPVDGTNGSIAAYAAENGLDFPMAKCSVNWISSFELNSYPTTVVIDRYGMICMIHKGAIPDTETFETVFEYFTADDYSQKIIRNISDIEK